MIAFHRENYMVIDFLITEGKKIFLLEVIPSRSSLEKFRGQFSSVIGNFNILYASDVMIKDGIIHLSLYIAELL